jgi:hypothetical protein
MRPFATLPALLALLAAACSDVPSPVSSAPEPLPEGFHAELACTASVHEGRVSCADAAPEDGTGAFPRLIIGGQNVYVRLASSGASYDARDSLFRVNVTVQNLMVQTFGTPDGTTDTGLRVFFYEGPDVTAGTGPVSVQHEDGRATFLNAMTPYYAYRGVLPRNGVSEAKSWRFKVGPQVQTFTFKVLVQGQLPHEGSLLRFRTLVEPMDRVYPVLSIWGPSASEVFAVGNRKILRYTGGAWVSDGGYYQRFEDVWGTSASDVYAVGDGTIVHWNGTEWRRVPTGHLCSTFEDEYGSYEVCPRFYGVWGSGPADVWVVGWTAGAMVDGFEGPWGLIVHYDGNEWSAQTEVPLWLSAVWGSAANDVWAVGFGNFYHYDGTVWEYRRGVASSDEVWGLSSTNVYAPYWDFNRGNPYSEAGVLHYDGSTWSAMPGLPSDSYYRYHKVWGTAPDNLFVAGYKSVNGHETGIIMHWDGSTWAEMNAGSRSVGALWGFGTNDVLASLDDEIVRGTR